MADFEPDYTKYSVDELLDVARRINREGYPDRAARLDAEVAARRISSKPQQPTPRAKLPGWLIAAFVIVGVLAVAPVVLMFIVSAGMSGGFAARDRVAKDVGYFRFEHPKRAVARLSAQHGSSWEFGFVDPSAAEHIGATNVTVTFVNHGPHQIYATWQQPDPAGFSVKNMEMALPENRHVVFWSGEYAAFHHSRTQLRFVDRSKLKKAYQVEVVLEFETAVPDGVQIKPYVNTPVI